MKAGSATLFESYLADAFFISKLDPSSVQFSRCDFEEPAHQRYARAAMKIVHSVRSHVPINVVQHVGSAGARVSDIYTKHGCRSFSSPKADLVSDCGNHRISLKSYFTCQIISGSKEEVSSIADVARQNSGLKTPEWKEFKRLIDQTMIAPTVPFGLSELVDVKHMRTKSGSNRPGLFVACRDSSIRSRVDSAGLEYLDQVLMGLEMMKGNKGSIKLNEFMIRNPRFYTEFIYEAMTGNNKFVDPNHSANSILSFTKAGVSRFDFLTYDALDLDKTKFRFRWKHGAHVRLAIDLNYRVR